MSKFFIRGKCLERVLSVNNHLVQWTLHILDTVALTLETAITQGDEQLQVRNDYLSHEIGARIEQDIAVQLCCLEIRNFFKDMPQIALDKKSNLEYLEKDVSNCTNMYKIILKILNCLWISMIRVYGNVMWNLQWYFWSEKRYVIVWENQPLRGADIDHWMLLLLDWAQINLLDDTLKSHE